MFNILADASIGLLAGLATRYLGLCIPGFLRQHAVRPGGYAGAFAPRQIPVDAAGGPLRDGDRIHRIDRRLSAALKSVLGLME